MFLRFESPAWPCHFAGLAVVDGKALVDEAGRLRLAELTDRTSRRLADVPELRRRLHFPGILRGGPLWVDDERFDIRNHIHEAAAEPPGGEAELLELAARLDERQLDRARPLWELWFLTGLRDGRVGVLLKLHHCVADGLAAVALMGSLFDVESDDAGPRSGRLDPRTDPRRLVAADRQPCPQDPDCPAGSRDAGSSATTRPGAGCRRQTSFGRRSVSTPARPPR